MISLPDTNGRRLYAIGDVHGRYDLLSRLLEMIAADKASHPRIDSQIIMLGDYIDRGPQSRQVCEALMALERSDAVRCLRGNHEQIVLDALAGDLMALRLWLSHGGVEAVRSWGLVPPVTDDADHEMAYFVDMLAQAMGEDMIRWLKDLPVSYRHGDYFFVHAGIRPAIALEEQEERDMLWIREPFLSSAVRHPAVIVHGHSIREDIEVRSNRIGIDTAAWKSGVLTAVVLENGHYRTLQTGRVGAEEA